MHSITVVALGTGLEEDLTLGAVKAMRRAETLILRTARCGAADYLAREGIPFSTLDDLYEQCGDFEELHRRSADRILEAAGRTEVCLAVFDPGQDGAVRLIREQVTQVIPGVSAGQKALTRVLPEGEIRICAAYEVDTASSQGTLCVTELDSRLLAGEVKAKLEDVYGADAPVRFFPQPGRDGRENGPVSMTLADLDRQRDGCYGHLCAAVLPRRDLTEKTRHDYGDLLRVMAILRGEGGCPWDRAQTHASLRPYLVEEAYETAAAIDDEDWAHVAEELGDVLLQVVFQASIARQYATFDPGDIPTAIVGKMIRRHRHIFGQDVCRDGEEVSRNWEKIKREERGFATVSEAMRDLPRSLPPLMRAEKILSRAQKGGMDVGDLSRTCEKARAAAAGLRDASTEAEREAWAQRLLFLCAACACMAGVECETALLTACDRMIRRFEELEGLPGDRKDAGKAFRDWLQ